MATIIDALVVTLGLDPKAFKQGAKETGEALDKTRKTADKAGQGIEASAKKGADAVTALRNQVLRTAAVFVGLGAIKNFFESTTKADAATGRAAQTMDVSAKGLSQWEQVAERAGLSGSAVASGMNGLADSLQRFALTGEGGDTFRFFRSLNVLLSDLKTGKMRDVRDIMLDVAERFQGMDPARAHQYGVGMGFNEDQIALLLKGRVALQKQLDETASTALNDDDVENAKARNKAWQALAQTFGRIARDILNTVTPAIVGLLNFIREHATPAASVLGAVATAMASISMVRFGGTLGSLAQLGGGIAGVTGQAGLLLSILGKVGLVGAAGIGAFGVTRFLMEGFGGAGDRVAGGFGAWLEEKINGSGPDMKGGYVPGTVRGLGRTGVAGGAVRPAGDGTSKQAVLRQLEQQFGLPTGLLDAVWSQESTRGQRMYSPKGAVGDFQFEQPTAAQYGVTDRMNFEQSARGAARMYADLMKKYRGSVPMALAGYNWGQGNLDRNGLGAAPLETQNYIRQITAKMRTGNASTSSSTSNEMHIQQVTVHTQATDPKGVANDMYANLVAAQANMGLN